MGDFSFSFKKAPGTKPPAQKNPFEAAENQFNAIRGIVLDAQGNVYVADAGNKRIQVFDGEGNVKSQITNVGTPAAMCITPGPHQYLYSSNSNDPETLSRLSMITRWLIMRGINPLVAQQQALAILDRQVSVQSSMLAFSKIYLYSGLVLIFALPLLLLFRTGRARGSMGPVH